MSNLITNAALSNFIHISKPADAELVKLAEGHLIRATVQRVQDEMALLNFNGKSIMVHSDVPLEPQQRVLLQVTQLSADKVSLQIMHQSSPAAATEGQLSVGLAPGNLQSLLTSWGLEADQTNQNIAKAIFANSQALNPETIQDVRTLWQTLSNSGALPPENGSKAGNLQALVYLHTNQLPVSEESVAMARHLLNNSFPVAERLTTLQQNLQVAHNQLQTLANQAQSTANTPQQQLLQAISGQNQPQLTASQTQALNNLLSTINSSLSQMANWSISPDTPAEQIVARLANLITNLGTPPETQLANQSGANTAAQTVLGKGSAAPHPATATGPGNNIPAAAKPTPEMSAQTTAQTAPTLLDDNSTTNPLQRLSSAISNVLANSHLNEQTTQILQNLAGQLEVVSHDLGAIQLSNLTNAPNPAMEPFYSFPIPLNTPDGPQTAHLKVYKRSGNSSVDPNNLRLALLLDLPDLGEMAINLTVFEKHLSGKILSGREQTHELVEADLDELGLNLNHLGYEIDSLTANILTPEEKTVFEQPEPIDSIEVPMPQINIIA